MVNKMKELYSFAISSNGKEDLKRCLDFLLQSIDIKAFSYEDMRKENKCRCLVFHTYKVGSNETYPFPVNSIILAEQIQQWLDSLNTEDFKKFMAYPTGYEESYEIGWELFSPDWYSLEYGIENYELSMAIAVKPKLLEYGK